MNLEQIYVDSEEFSFEEILAKKRGLYGLRFEVEKPKTPSEIVRFNENSSEITKSEKPPMEHVFRPVPERSPLLHKAIALTPSPPALQPAKLELETNDDDIVYMPIRGAFK